MTTIARTIADMICRESEGVLDEYGTRYSEEDTGLGVGVEKRGPTPTAKAEAKKEKINVWAGSGENREFSNLAPRPFDFEGRHYFSVEHAYQTLKSGEFDRATYAKYTSGGYRKIPGRQAKTDGGYNIKLMERLMAASFQQNPGAMDALRKTGRAEITHVQDRGVWRDEFPRILMEIRDAKAETWRPAHYLQACWEQHNIERRIMELAGGGE